MEMRYINYGITLYTENNGKREKQNQCNSRKTAKKTI